MTREEAIKQAIRKWESIAAGIGVDVGPLNCALCKKYFYNDSCNDCPIAKNVGNDGCNCTSYIEWMHHMFDYHNARNESRYPLFALCQTCREIAQREVNFLEGLLKR